VIVEFFNNMKREIKEQVRVAEIARVESYDSIRKRANVTPRGYSMISNALVLEHVTIEPGDNVLVVFCDTALDDSSEDRHRIEDAIVVGKVRL